MKDIERLSTSTQIEEGYNNLDMNYIEHFSRCLFKIF